MVGAKSHDHRRVQTGRLNNDDEAGFIAFLVDASSKMLKAQGQPDQADKIIAFFNDSSKDGGVQQLASNLRMINTMNNRNSTNPNNRNPRLSGGRRHGTNLAKDHGIIVSAKFLLATGKQFQPSGPPRQRN